MGAPRTCLMLCVLAASLALAGCGPKNEVQSGGQVVSSGAALIGGPFQLIDQDGKPADQRLLEGKWSAVFFGYTYCPDVCPTTLQVLAQAQAQLGGDARHLRVVLISIDPERDTPAQLKAYLATPSFPRELTGLTGSAEQVAAAAKAYRVYYKKKGEGEAYLMDHSAIIYLMDPKGQFDRVLTEAQPPAQLAAQIKDAMASGPKASS